MPKNKNKEKQNLPNPVGRPSLYKIEYSEEAFKRCLLGATDKELADYFDVSESTLYLWKNEFPEFSESIKKGKEKADSEIASALYNRAKGAEWTEDSAFKIKRVVYDETGKKCEEFEEIITVPVRRAAPPDTPAASLWLRNRQPENWRDKQDIEHTGKDGKDLIPEMTDIETARRIAFGILMAEREKKD